MPICCATRRRARWGWWTRRRRGRSRRRSASAGWKLDLILITHHHADHIDGGRGAARRTGAGGGRGGGPARGCRALDVALEDGRHGGARRERGRGLRGAGAYGRAHRLLFRRGGGALLGRQPDGDGLRAAVRGDAGADVGEPLDAWRRCRTTTLVYSGHEYAESNTRFALSVDAENVALKTRAAEIAAMRQKGGATVPARLDLERATNPFLRARDAGLQGAAGAGEFAGCPSFRRGPAPQGCFLSRRCERRLRRVNRVTAFFLRFAQRAGILPLKRDG